jgi:hypothetical protein
MTDRRLQHRCSDSRKSGEGAVQIPVDSVATAQLPLPPFLGQILAAMGLFYFARRSPLSPPPPAKARCHRAFCPAKPNVRKYWKPP